MTASAAGSSPASTSSSASGASTAAPRARSCTTTTDNEQLGIIMRGALDFRIGDPDDERRAVLNAGDVYLAPQSIWHGDSIFIGDDEYGECWILDVFAPPRDDLHRRGARQPMTARKRNGDGEQPMTATGGSPSTSAARSPTSSCSTLRPGDVVVDKTLTTPSNPLDGVRTGRRAAARPGRRQPGRHHGADRPRHDADHQRADRGQDRPGRRSSPPTGFGDTLLIRDEHRYDMYDLQIEFPAPPIPRDADVRTRRARPAAGEVVVDADRRRRSPRSPTPLARGAGRGGRRSASSTPTSTPPTSGVVADHLRRELGVPVCISAEVSPQIREYPRMITTACNAATMPVIGPYLDELQKWLAGEGFGGSVLMMLSNGGVVSADDAARIPIRLVESGPAAGALAGSWFADRLGEDRLLCFDMGGTTAKACLIEHGEPELTNTFEVARVYRFKKGSGFPVSVPSVDLVEIGAGGGSARPHRPLRPAQGRPRIGRRRTRARRRTAAAAPSPPVTDADLVARPARRRQSSSAATCRSTPTPPPAPRAKRRRRSSASTSSTPPPASTRSSTRTWPPPPACTPSSRASTCAASPCSPSAAPARSTPAASPSCSSRDAGHLPGQRQRAVGVRHARVTRCASTSPASMRPPARRDRRRPSATRCSTSCAPRAVGCSPPPASTPTTVQLPLRHRRPLPRPGQRGHRVGRRGRRVARPTDAERASPRSRPSTDASTG